ncbi:MAG TPA: BON domain-containing protein [Pirellulales bacterium]|nr:BON domain-containing protein [Pirellulales bacterium]
MALRTELDFGASDLRTAAQAALTDGPIAALRGVRVEQAGNSLLLSGMVTSFYHKQLAQEQVRLAVGDVEIVNSIVVL